MTSISQNLRYLPHTIDTRYHALLTYRNGASVNFICRRYKVSKASLMRWNKHFDGTKESLRDKSHRPLKPHPKAHTMQELTWIQNCIRRNPTATLIEIFYKLKKQFPSETFSQLISETTVKGYSDITFIIGGSLGLDPRIKKRANVLMSFGLLTLPHQLMRLVLIEQIYRAFMIAQGSPYHK